MSIKHVIAVGILLSGPALASSKTDVTIGGGSTGVSVLRGGEQPTRGSGRFIRQARPADQFTNIEADDGVNVEITVGQKTSMEVEADDNLIQRITTRVEGGTLKVGASGSYATQVAPVVRVTVPGVRRIDLRTSSSALIKGLRGGRIALSSNGSGDFTADGWVDEMQANFSGSGGGDLSDLEAARVSIAINGSGRARVLATREISATVNGSGHLTYSGNPGSVNEDVNGSGSIRRVSN